MESPTDILLAKWLNKTISHEELELLQQEYDLGELNLILSKQQNLDFDTEDSSVLWENLNLKLETLDAPTLGKDSVTTRSFPWLTLIVVAFGLLLLGFGLTKWLGSKADVISSPKAKTIQQVIAGNTEFILSPGSKLEYDESKWSTERKFSLSGHAYFDVAKGPTFEVSTPAGKVAVLGTQFEVWEKDGSMKVNCLDGRVEVTNLKGQSIIIAKDESVYIIDGNINSKRAHTLQKAEFLSSRYNYEKISIVSLAQELERYYDVEVSLDQIDDKINFSGVLILNDIDKACAYIAETLNLKYERVSTGIKFSKT